MLSGLLCNYFFGHIERCLLGRVLETLPPCTTSRPPANACTRQAATAAGFLRGGDFGGGGSDGKDGLRGHAPGWDGGATTGAPSLSGSRRPEGGGSPDRSTAGRKRARLAAEGVEQDEQEEEGDGRDENHGERAGAGARGVRATHAPCHGSRPAETGGAAQERAGTPSGGVFPNPEGDCTLLRQVDDFLLVSTRAHTRHPSAPCNVPLFMPCLLETVTFFRCKVTPYAASRSRSERGGGVIT